jgi:hypothetical protein
MRKIEKWCLRLLLAILPVCGFLIIVGYLYQRNSTCSGNPWDCLEFELMLLGGAILLFCLPLVAILFIWEISKKIKKKTEANRSSKIELDLPEPAAPKTVQVSVPKDYLQSDELSEKVVDLVNRKNE